MEYLELEAKVKEAVSNIEWIQGAGKSSRERMFADSVEEEFSQELVSIWFVREIFRRLGNQDAEVYFNDVESLISDSENLADLFHPMMFAPLGTILALIAQVDSISIGDHFSASNNSLVRATVAAATSDSKILEYLSYDPCMVVRTIVAVSDYTERETRNKLAIDPFFDVRRRTIYGDSDAVREFDRKIDAIFKEQAEGDFVDWRAFACECSSSKMKQEISALDTLRETERDFYSFFVEEQKLFVPNIPRELASRLREFDEIHWATQPFPSPREDYIFQLEEYLMGVIPDQYSISHWGHGINSYSLNFRFAIEELAVLGQVAWYGAYNDPESCREAWNEMATYMDEIIQMKQREFSGKPRKRDVVILFSNFRSDSSGVWERRKNPVSLEDEWIRVLESGFLKDITQFMRGRA